MKCRTDRIPRSAAPSDLLRVIECNLCMPHVCIHGSTQCAVEKAPTRSQLLTCYFFFFFFKKYELSVEFGSEKYAKTWELLLRKFNKSRNGQF